MLAYLESHYRSSYLQQSKCPHCAISRGYSKAQIDRIELIMKEEDIDIQYLLSPEKEYNIEGIGRGDGYCPEKNDIYEYHILAR